MRTLTEVVTTFLNAMPRRDFATMESVMAPDFKMKATTGDVYRHPKDFMAASSRRQKTARKTTDRYEEIPTAPGCGVVYSIGSMAGEWNDGSAYEGVRYIDRFEIADGKIVELSVYSDMAEFRPKA